MKTRHILWAILALFLALPHSGKAQTTENDPFHVPTLTLSKGKYIEIHDQDSIVQIGRALLNVKTQQLVGWAEEDTTYGNDAFQADVASRWLSPDPKSDEFSSWSPYNFVEDNPIRLIDPDGRAAVLPEGLLPENTKTWIPLSKSYLVKIATDRGIAERARRTGDNFGRLVGQGFENSIMDFAGRSPNYQKFPTDVRRKYRNVMPDLVLDKTSFKGRFDLLSMGIEVERQFTENGQMVNILDNNLTNFSEVKTSPRLSLSSNDYQLAGMIDVISQQKVRDEAGGVLGNVKEMGGGVLFLVTTSDTKIGLSLLDYASEHGVTVFQSEAYLDPNDPSKSTFRITTPGQLNADFDKGFARHRKNKEKIEGKPLRKFIPGKGTLKF